MSFRVLAVLLSGVVLAPALGQPVGPGPGAPMGPAGMGGGFRQDRVINRQRITWLRPEPMPLMQEQGINRMRITTVLPPPMVPAQPGPCGPQVPPMIVPGPAGPVKAVGGVTEEVLSARKWTCGRAIDDTCGRRWILVHGDPHWDRPARLPGWVLRADNGGVPFFFSRTGRMYRLVQMPARLGTPLSRLQTTKP